MIWTFRIFSMLELTTSEIYLAKLFLSHLLEE